MNLTRLSSLASGLIGLTFAGGCREPVSCDPCRSSAVANVFVRHSTTQMPPRVNVLVLAYPKQCGVLLRGEGGGAVLDGYRRFVLSSLYSPFTARCFEVTVTEPVAGDTLASAQFTGAVRFEYPQPTDSARFDVVIPGIAK